MSQFELPCLGPESSAPFPDSESALQKPNGLLAWGGDLSVPRLLAAYRQGIFPWYSAGDPILWWTPDPRCVLKPADVHISSRTRRRYNTGQLRITADHDFAGVIRACAGSREFVGLEDNGTWITLELEASFLALHELGFAHSVEVWHGEQLVGGIYGMAIGEVFFGESMFSHSTDASKIALIALCKQLEQWSFGLLDCQVVNPHLLSMGASEIARTEFKASLNKLVCKAGRPGSWKNHFAAANRW